MAAPSLVVFDLDECMWSPETFELKGPFEKAADGRVLDTEGVELKLYPGALRALQQVHSDMPATRVAVASAGRFADWARGAMHMFEVVSGVTFADMVAFCEIHPCETDAGKAVHFEDIRAASGVPFDQMVFWDDCTWGDNCADVRRGCPGVVTCKTPHGMTDETWAAGLAEFAASSKGPTPAGD